MKMPLLIIAAFCALVLSQPEKACANLLTNGTFQSVTFSGTPPAGSYNTAALIGQFGSDSVAGFATGSNLTVAGWDTSGYNFVFAPNTADRGTQANAYINSGPGNSNREVPGQYSVQHNGAGSFYGNTYFWGNTGSASNQSNGGLGTMTTSGHGTGNINAVYNAAGSIVAGNFIALDGVYEVHPVSQTVTGLSVGKTYILTFYYAGAQQEAFNGDTTESLTINFGGTFVSGPGAQSGSFTGGTSYTTATISLPEHSFSGWYEGSVSFVATSTSTTVNFLAGGTPTGQPPFTLLGGVDMELVPEFSNWMVFAGFGILCIFFELLRRRKSPPGVLPEAGAFTLTETLPSQAAVPRI